MKQELTTYDYCLLYLSEINRKYAKFEHFISDYEMFKKEVNDLALINNRQIMNFIINNDEVGLRKYLYKNFIEEKYFPKKKVNSQINETKTSIIEKLEEIHVKPLKKGRPKGSKNKPKETIVNIPIHSVNDQNFIDAIKDILWYSNGLMAKQIIDHLDHDESITKLLYAKLHEYKNVHWTERRINVRYGKSIYKWYPIGERKGYFFDGKLRSITNIAECINMNKVTLWKRIKSGMNHIEAINKPIDANMVRNGKNS